MKQAMFFLLLASISLFVLTGCQESEANQIRRARVIANENIQLKKQLAEKDQHIAELNKQIEELNAEIAEKDETFGNTTLRTLQMVSESEKQNQELMLENKKLKAELEKLKNK